MVNDENLDGGLARFEPEPKLLLYYGDCRGHLVRRTTIRLVETGEVQGEVVPTLEFSRIPVPGLQTQLRNLDQAWIAVRPIKNRAVCSASSSFRSGRQLRT